LVPLLEESSLEEDETLQDKWVGLLVNYIDSSKTHQSSVFPYILNQLSTLEAQTLDYIKSEKGFIHFNDLAKKINICKGEISNLIRLGLLSEDLKIQVGAGEYDEDGNWQQDVDNLSSDKYYLTTFGYEFLDACEIEK
jgi:hypothetical protein